MLNAKFLTLLINEWRIGQKLKPYVTDDRLCSLSNDRVLKDERFDNHKGQKGRVYDPYYAIPKGVTISENIGISTSEYLLLQSWLASPTHAEALRHDYKYSCVACSGDYCVQEFSNF